MSKNTGGPAFPGIEVVVTGIDSEGIERFDTEASGGMTLRDYFAAKAMSGILSTWTPEQSNFMVPETVASDSYAFADAMLAERAK